MQNAGREITMEERREAAEGLTERASKYLKSIPKIFKRGVTEKILDGLGVEKALTAVPNMTAAHIHRYLNNPGETPVTVKLALAGYFIAEASADQKIIKERKKNEKTI